MRDFYTYFKRTALYVQFVKKNNPFFFTMDGTVDFGHYSVKVKSACNYYFRVLKIKSLFLMYFVGILDSSANFQDEIYSQYY